MKELGKFMKNVNFTYTFHIYFTCSEVQSVANGKSASAGAKSKEIDSNADYGIAYRVLTPSMYRS